MLRQGAPVNMGVIIHVFPLFAGFAPLFGEKENI
jgi:hypothetical protein